MKCPHCLKEIHCQTFPQGLGADADGFWIVNKTLCPACNRFILHLLRHNVTRMPPGGFSPVGDPVSEELVRPKGANRPPPPQEVPETLAADFKEACLVLPDSAQASAALSRRCLQHLLRDFEKVKRGNLADEIQEVLARGKLPQHIADSIDAIRNIGNFGAHPMKSQSTGEILPVGPGEAEWNLDVLESLFDFYFVQPAATKKKRAALDAKLKAAGKPPMK